MAKLEAALEGQEDEEDRLIEERRRRRQEILAKHRQAASGSVAPGSSPGRALSQGVSQIVSHAPPPSPGPSTVTGPTAAPADDVSQAPQRSPLPRPESRGGESTPSVCDEEDEAFNEAQLWQQHAAGDDQAPAGGDVTMGDAEASDRRERERALGVGPPAQADAGDRGGDHPAAEAEQTAAAAGGDVDMFAETAEADIFAETPPERPGGGPAKPLVPKTRALADAYDDADGYYNFQVGEIMDDRYEVFANVGKGVFSTVLRARDMAAPRQNGAPPPEVAIKMIRANDTMYKAGQLEKVICNKLAGADLEGRRHCIRMLRSFEYRGHLCLVFEPLDMNLRELTNKYGRGVGLNIQAVRMYAAQLLQALHHMKNCGVLHADLKPDNILVNQQRNVVKVCDFGSAMFEGEGNDITPYLVSRFYRAPEIILGMKYSHPIDMWALGCVIYELFTGKILFGGRTNNEMLKLQMDVKGGFPRKMLKKGTFVDQHFEGEPNYVFGMMEQDAVTKRPVRRLIANPTVQRDVAALLAGAEGERVKVQQLVDLLEKMLALDPEKRLTPKDALRHPFIKDHPRPQRPPAGKPAKGRQ